MIGTRAAAAAALSLLLLTTAPTAKTKAPAWFRVSERGLVGTLGPLKLRMMISVYGEGEISGSYYFSHDEPYARNWMTDIQLQGRIDRAGNFTMEERTGESLEKPEDEEQSTDAPEEGEAAAPEDPLDSFGVFTGKLTHGPPGARPSIRLEGTWTLPDGTHPVPFALAEVPSQSKVRITQKSYGEAARRPRFEADAKYPSIAGIPAFERSALREIRDSVRVLRENADQDTDVPTSSLFDMSTLEIDYEVTYASPSAISVLYRAHYWVTVFITHDMLGEYGATYDLRRHKWITLRDIFGPSYYKDLSPVVREAVKGTYWDYAVTGGQDQIATADFYLVEGGVMLLFPTDHNTGQVAEIFVPHSLP